MNRQIKPAAEEAARLLDRTSELVTRLIAENRALKARNLKLTVELARISKGWNQVVRLARTAPRWRGPGC